DVCQALVPRPGHRAAHDTTWLKRDVDPAGRLAGPDGDRVRVGGEQVVAVVVAAGAEEDRKGARGQALEQVAAAGSGAGGESGPGREVAENGVDADAAQRPAG